MKGIGAFLVKVFAYGITGCLFAGGLSFLGYLIGIMVGGEFAEYICEWLFNTYLFWVIKFTSGFTGIGLLGMYVCGQKALTFSAEQMEKE